MIGTCRPFMETEGPRVGDFNTPSSGVLGAGKLLHALQQEASVQLSHIGFDCSFPSHLLVAVCFSANILFSYPLSPTKCISFPQ